MRRSGSTPAYRLPPQTNWFALAVTFVFAASVVVVVGVGNLKCREVVVWTSAEKSDLLLRIEREYSPDPVERRCVDIVIRQVNSGEAEAALTNDVEVGGTLPVVWTPAAETWALLLSHHRTQLGKKDIVPPSRPSLAQSPLVIAMLEEHYNTLRTCRSEIGWLDIIEFAEDPSKCPAYTERWGRFRLAKTNPTISTSGLHALLSVYSACANKTGPLELEEVQRPDVKDCVHRVEQSVVHYARTVGQFLETLYEEDFRRAALTYVSAIAVEEKQAFDYNRGNPGSAPCLPFCPKTKPIDRLVAIYPKEALFADHPYMVLNADWVDGAERQAALAFLDHLGSKQDLFAQDGFRDSARQADPKILEPPYFDVNQPRSKLTLSRPSVLAEMQSSWSVLRKQANILFVYDVSTSMMSQAEGHQTTKLDLLRQATCSAVKRLNVNDSVGLWTFPVPAGGPAYREVMPITRLGTGEGLCERLADLRDVSGERRLYTAVRASVDHLRARFASDKINAVILVSDGEDSSPRSELDRLVSFLRTQPEDQRVRVFTLAFDFTALGALREIAHGSKGFPYNEKDIEKVLRDVISNF